MKDYNKSDYALNIVSENIVYRFADRIVEVTLSDYLRENPEKSEQDFNKLKELSDELYHQDVIIENRTTRDNFSITGLEETLQDTKPTAEEILIHNHDIKNALSSAYMVLQDQGLTEKQKRRFNLHFFLNKSFREIAKTENVSHIAVYKSVSRCIEKLKKYFF